jgi:O-antigen/teichoic acid export membrane protein
MAILKNTARLLIGRIASDGLAILFYIFLARTFGESGMGNYSFAFSVAALVGLGIEFGLRPLVTRNISRKSEMAVDYFGNLIVFQATLSLLLGLILYLIIRKLSYSDELLILIILAFIAAALRAMGLTFVAFLEAKEAMGKSAILEVISRLVITVLGFAMILVGVKLQTILIAHIAGSFVFACIALYWIQKLFGPLKIRINSSFIIKILREALPFACASALYTLYARMDVMMLYYFRGEQETGLYAVAFRCIESSLIIASLVGLSIYPVLSKAYSQFFFLAINFLVLKI